MKYENIELQDKEQLLMFHLSEEVSERYNEILKTRNLTHAEFIIGALYLFEAFT